MVASQPQRQGKIFDEDERYCLCLEENEWCTTYEKCIFKEDPRASFFQHKVTVHANLRQALLWHRKDDYVPGDITTTECKAKCDQDGRCVVYARKEMNGVPYEKCVLLQEHNGRQFLATHG